MSTWTGFRKILCIRPDNMGDLLMSAPAIAALKETFGCHITVLTSPMASGIVPYLASVDELIEWNAPWVKDLGRATLEDFNDIVLKVRNKNFDAAVIFTVFSQNPLPSALIATLAGIPVRLAYCRENPYHLLSHWIPEKEPYDLLRHQVRRDLDLVRSVGATVTDERITLRLPAGLETAVRDKIAGVGANPSEPWLILHPGVSELKRAFNPDLWIDAGKRIASSLGHQLIITGTEKERALAETIRNGIANKAFSLAGKLSLDELITLIRFAPLLISVNTGTVHLAAAVQTKVIVLYALTNPQHTPWKTIGKVLPFSVDDELQSKNEVLRFLQKKYFQHKHYAVAPEDIINAARELLIGKEEPEIEELVLPGSRMPGSRFRVPGSGLL